MTQYNEKGEVRAAGGIVVDPSPTGLRILMVHRPAYDDWSIPKGKVRRGEEDAAAALREVAEETGLSCDLGDEVGKMHYRDRKGRAKVARYWVMSPKKGQFEANGEVDRYEWLDLETAAARATRSGDRDFLNGLAKTVRCVEKQDGYRVKTSSLTIVYEED